MALRPFPQCKPFAGRPRTTAPTTGQQPADRASPRTPAQELDDPPRIADRLTAQHDDRHHALPRQRVDLVALRSPPGDAALVDLVAAGPSSSVDGSLPSGDEIEIEERGADEVRGALGAVFTVPGTPVRNPAFDVTPAELVWALVTEKGVSQRQVEG